MKATQPKSTTPEKRLPTSNWISIQYTQPEFKEKDEFLIQIFQQISSDNIEEISLGIAYLGLYVQAFNDRLYGIPQEIIDKILSLLQCEENQQLIMHIIQTIYNVLRIDIDNLFKHNIYSRLDIILPVLIRKLPMKIAVDTLIIMENQHSEIAQNYLNIEFLISLTNIFRQRCIYSTIKAHLLSYFELHWDLLRQYPQIFSIFFELLQPLLANNKIDELCISIVRMFTRAMQAKDSIFFICLISSPFIPSFVEKYASDELKAGMKEMIMFLSSIANYSDESGSDGTNYLAESEIIPFLINSSASYPSDAIEFTDLMISLVFHDLNVLEDEDFIEYFEFYDSASNFILFNKQFQLIYTIIMKFNREGIEYIVKRLDLMETMNRMLESTEPVLIDLDLKLVAKVIEIVPEYIETIAEDETFNTNLNSIISGDNSENSALASALNDILTAE